MSIRRLIAAAVVLGVAGLVVFYWLTIPKTLSAQDLPDHKPDVANGEYMFHASGCGSCHLAPGSKDKTRLAGGVELKTPFGTFVAPNISSHKEDGIGAWSELEFANAVLRGVSPGGSHYYPAFPYASYQKMRIEDVLDVKAYIDTLPAVAGRAPGHDLALPFRLRRGLGLWKLLALDYQAFSSDPAQSDEVNRGRYLVTGPGHCGECHTPRNLAGIMDASRELAGGPSPEGEGRIPNITPHPSTNVGKWSKEDIAETLSTGFLPDFSDNLGGSMTSVVENMSHLRRDDLLAMAAYLKSVAPVSAE